MQFYEKAFKRLNQQQKKAVETIDGPVLVVAGPGTGKTQMLALRIAHILKMTDATPDNILCLTFTEAGVLAMRERLFSFIGKDAYRVAIHTYHSFSNEIIQTFPEKFSFSKELIQLDDVSRIKLLKNIIDSTEDLDKLKPFYNKYAKLYEITSAIQIVKKEGITSEELAVKSKHLLKDHELNPTLNRQGKPTVEWKRKKEKFEQLVELSCVYKRYQNELDEKGFYDYEDMIQFVNEKFSEDRDFLAYYQEQYLYILVDEYQDTNGSQSQILYHLTGREEEIKDLSANIFVVGDDDQAIYRFQGANIGNILHFTEIFENPEIIITPVNYRSTQTILNIADSIISNNETRLVHKLDNLEKKLTSGLNLDNVPAELWELHNQDEELIFIAREIQKLFNQGEKYEDIAVLYRKNKHAEDLAIALQRFNVPTKIDVSENIFDIKIIQQLVQLLKLIELKRISSEEIYYILLYEFIGLNPVEVYKCNDFIKREKSSFKDFLLKNDFRENKESMFESVRDFGEIIAGLHQKSANMKLSNLVETVLNQFAILDFVQKQDVDPANDIGEMSGNFNDVLAINSFFNYIKLQEGSKTNVTLSEFLNDLEILDENNIKVSLPKSKSTDDAVHLMTAHSAKGLEFKHVFIFKSTDNNWGSTRSQPSVLVPELFNENQIELDSKQLNLEDERRLFFVAITRAKQKVYFTYAKEYIANGIVSTVSPSRFLNEIDERFILKKSVDKDDIEFNAEDYITILTPRYTSNYSKEEEKYLKEKVSQFKLSASALNEYLESPKQFKENRLLRIPQVKSKHLALGTSIHYAFELFNRKLLIQKENTYTYESLDFLLFQFAKKLKQEFLGDDDFERTKQEGVGIISKYYDHYVKTGLYKKPIEVEYNFSRHSVFIDNGVDEPVVLTGKIDKVEFVDAESNSVRVIDYKTAKPQSDNYIKGNTKSSNGAMWRQLVFYKLLTEIDSRFKPKNKFTSKYNVTEVQIDFLRDDKGKFVKRTFEVTKNDVADLKELIFEVMKKIRNLEFDD